MGSLPSQSGRTYVVTGANSGLGRETARELGAAGAHVVMAVRDPAKAQRVAADLTGSFEVMPLDLADLASVRAFAQRWGQRPIHSLVNNAGIMMTPKARTVDGFELQMGTNHLGHFALTNLLLPFVADRVVSVSSFLHHGPQVDLADFNQDRRYRPAKSYQQSKLANLLFSSELQRRLSTVGSSVQAMTAHPGYAATNLQGHFTNPAMKLFMRVGDSLIATDAATGARPILHALTADVPADSFIGPTRFFHLRGAPGLNPRSAQAQDVTVARQLWELSEKLTDTTFPL